MKQLTINSVVEAFREEPTTIGNRLEMLGVSAADAKKKFSEEILNTSVYASSFAKFLQDNAAILSDKIPAKELPENYKNPFEDGSVTLGDRLFALGVLDEAKDAFSKDVLNLKLNGDEFQDFIVKNQEKFLGTLEQLATKGG